MNQSIIIKIKHTALLAFSVFIFNQLHAQTDIDAIMMGKNAFCGGPMYSYSSWKNYWEGALKRDNQNLGRVSTQMYSSNDSWRKNSYGSTQFSVVYIGAFHL